MIAALALLLAVGAADAGASKKQRYLADKQLAPPRAAECCAPGLQVPDAACRIDAACRPPPPAGTEAARVLTARNLWTEERTAWSGPVVLERAALGSFLRDHGAETVSVASLDYVLDRENPLFARLEAFLRQ